MKLTTICYIEDNNKTLLVHRNKSEDDVHEGKYVGICGEVVNGETPEECVLREVFNQTNLNLKSIYYRGVITLPKFIDNEDVYMMLFTSDDFEGRLDNSCKYGDLIWIDTDKIFDLDMWEGDRLYLRWSNTDEIFSAKIIYENGKLKDYNVVFQAE